jgi:hypothetical protein
MELFVSNNVVTYLGVIIDGVWIGDTIYWPLIHTTRNYKELQRYR